ncbi:uncharacterized protein LACBIDRAFT_332049 [Laccaria bicolor S238N-H82]|uniref:Predicted protein n=1 Tax=Laccaria bicolor (strain S238N-H82 / ATCC MYA-4686) TaxID=486041 RepID=B0DRE8_LACBS|nr:uncharacterized protein LACBIDRAFT_332049 [Laccaria bicolor S238N-H82]EDR02772.1 predicted protein [Laccaria bicolor S238N-H82]|eukprot:XP_001886482.1 predicted protein [Laccaria bicolor S238N-H82]
MVIKEVASNDIILESVCNHFTTIYHKLKHFCHSGLSIGYNLQKRTVVLAIWVKNVAEAPTDPVEIIVAMAVASMVAVTYEITRKHDCQKTFAALQHVTRTCDNLCLTKGQDGGKLSGSNVLYFFENTCGEVVIMLAFHFEH